MIRKNEAFLNRVNIVLDLLLVVFSYILATWIRFDFLDGKPDNMAAQGGTTILLAFAYALVLSFLLALFGFYNTNRTRRMAWKARTIFFCTTLATLAATALLFLFRLVDFSRGALFAFYAITLLLLIGKYAFMRGVLRKFRGKGYNLKHVVVVGTGDLARQYRDDLAAEPELGFHIKGFVGAPREGQEDYLGGFDALEETLSETDISEAVIALDAEEYVRIREIIACCERNGVKYSVIPFYNDIIPANPVIETIGRSKLINMRSNRLENIGWKLLKRGFDMLASGLGLVLLSPFMLLIALGVKRSSPGPVFFRTEGVHHAEVPQHAGEQRTGHRLEPGQGRPEDALRQFYPQDQPGRAAPADQRLQGRDEPGGPPAGAAALRGTVPGDDPLLHGKAPGEARHDRLGAGQRLPRRHEHREADRDGPVVYRPLEPRPGPEDPVQNRVRREHQFGEDQVI